MNQSPILLLGVLHLAAAAVPNGAAVHHGLASARRLQEDFGFNGTTAEEVCDSVLENWYFEGFPEKFQTSCTCTPNDSTGGYSVRCTDYCTYCRDETCSIFSSSFELNSDLFVTNLAACDLLQDEAYGQVRVCRIEDYTANPPTYDYYVWAQKCASTDFVECPSLGYDVPLIDCSNAGYGSSMNYCDASTVEGPFVFLQALYFSTIDDYTADSCVPAECRDELNVADACTESSLSTPQVLECLSCYNDATDAILTDTDPNTASCWEAHTNACSLFRQCDAACGTCANDVKTYRECYLESLYSGDCDFDCSVPAIPSQCQDRYNATDGCVRNELSINQASACDACITSAVDSIVSTEPAPTNCTDANSRMCFFINQCDDECLSCEDEFEEYTECFFSALVPLGCEFDCAADGDTSRASKTTTTILPVMFLLVSTCWVSLGNLL